MKLLRFIPATLTFCMIFGILFGFYFPPNITLLITTLVITLLVLTTTYFIANKSFKKTYFFNITAYFLFFLIGMANISFQHKLIHKNHYSHHIKENNTAILTIEKQLKSNIYYQKYETRISQINNTSVNGKILLNIRIDSTNKSINIDDEILINTRFKTINEPLNLYQFNYRAYLEKQQIYHQVSVSNSEIYAISKRDFSLNGIASRFRKKINVALHHYHFKKNKLSIINALLLGQRNEVSKELLQQYAGAGAMHILAVSGLHIGILLLLLNLLLKPIERLKNGKTIKLILVIFLLWLYAIIAGLSPSIIRAVSMFTAIAIGLLSNKKTNTLHNLFISLFFLLLINPLYIFSVGFQLSYLAVISIVYFYPLFIRFYNPKNSVLKKIWQLFTISLSAQIGILPLSLYYFHQFPILFFVSSIVIVFFLGLILGLGILVIALALIGILPQFFADFYGNIIWFMNTFIAFIAKQESFVLRNITFSLALLVCLYLIIIFGFRYWNKSNPNKLILVLVSLVIFQVTVIYEKRNVEIKQEFVVFNKSKKTIISIRKGKQTTIYHSLDTSSILKNKALIDYKTGTGKLNYMYNLLKNSYQFNHKKILLIDSLGIYNIPNLNPNIIVLTQSPRLNIARLIAITKPKLIIADASNYKSYKKRWKVSCEKNKIDFYDTSINGAFVLK